MTINFDEYTTEEIKAMISEGKCTEQDVINYYGNEWWDEGFEIAFEEIEGSQAELEAYPVDPEDLDSNWTIKLNNYGITLVEFKASKADLKALMEALESRFK